jgi:23S rRNA (adenine2503-C2)-methyltransferase
MQAVTWITSEKALGMSSRRITLSTSGIAKMIYRMADEKTNIRLALSLHACDDRKRSALMPINESNNLEAIKKSLVYFYQNTGNRITLEYILLGGFNDSETDARNLVRFASHFPCKVNLIEYNPIAQANYARPKVVQMEHFKSILEKKGLIVNLRRSRGKDIDAACGQLATREDNNKSSVGSQQLATDSR